MANLKLAGIGREVNGKFMLPMEFEPVMEKLVSIAKKDQGNIFD